MTDELEQAKKKIWEKTECKLSKFYYTAKTEFKESAYGIRISPLELRRIIQKVSIRLALQAGIKIGRKGVAEEIFGEIEADMLSENPKIPDSWESWEKFKRKHLGGGSK